MSAAAQSETLSSENCLKVRRTAAKIPLARSCDGLSGPSCGPVPESFRGSGERPTSVVFAAARSKSSSPRRLASAASSRPVPARRSASASRLVVVSLRPVSSFRGEAASPDCAAGEPETAAMPVAGVFLSSESLCPSGL